MPRQVFCDSNNRRNNCVRTFALSIVTILTILGALYITQTQEIDYDAGVKAYKRGHYETAMYEFEPRAMRGDPIAQFYVGRMYHQGHGVNKDEEEVERWYKMAAEQNEPRAQYYLAILYLGWENKDVTMIKGTIRELLKNALKNPQFSKKLVAEAQYQLGKIYEDANGEEAKPDSARYWYEKAAEQGLAEAQFKLGEMYHDGEGMKEAKSDSAKYWYEKAADRMDEDTDIGHAEAQYNLSVLYFENVKLYFKNLDKPDSDQDVTDDFVLALTWLERAVNQGLDKAQYQRAIIYHWNWPPIVKAALLSQKIIHKRDFVIPERNFKKAEDWYEKAAKQGLTEAQNDLAAMYDKCIDIDDLLQKYEGIPQGYQKDYEDCKQLGNGIKKKSEKIARLYLGAAQQGHADSQYNLGLRFEKGLTNDEGEILIKKNYEEAYYWYSLAASTRERTWENNVKERIVDKDKIEVDQNLKKKIDEGVKRTEKQLTDNDNEKREIEDLVNSWKPKESRSYSGTGFYINSEYILTNAHVVCSNYPSSPCKPYDELRIPFQRVDVDTNLIDQKVDLALLRVDSTSVESITNEYPVAKLRSNNIQLGEKVAVFGYPQSHILSYLGNFTEGIVSGLSGVIIAPQASNLFQYTAPIQSGNSGGPVFDGAGNVIGVVVSRFENYIYIKDDKPKIENFQNINFAINLNTIKEFLDKTKVPYGSTTSDSPLTLKEIAKRAKMFTVPVLGFKNK